MSSRKQRARAQVEAELNPATKTVKKIQTALSGVDAEQILFRTGQISLLYALVLPGSTFGPIANVLSFLGLLIPGLLRQKWFFSVFAGIVLFNFIIGAVWSADNHNWLQWYWFVALALVNYARDSQWALALSSRLLIGGTFTLATSWKILAHDFPNGSFFEFAGGTENRMAESLNVIGFNVKSDYNANIDSIKALASGFEAPAAFELVGADMISGFWPIMAAMTILIEGAIAILYLAPLRKTISWLRDAVMVSFCFATYLLLPVGGFGMLLVAMGFAASDLEMKRRTWVYGITMSFVMLMVQRTTLIPRL
jgi:hypothetical protein